MDRNKKSLIFLDTHIVLWLYDNLQLKFSNQIKSLMNSKDVQISPIVLLELAYLKEIKRIKDSPKVIYKELNVKFGLKQSNTRLELVITKAIKLNWTRDLFDRLIVATASKNNCILITADRNILKNYEYAIAPK